jgi:hypothetical protein
LSTNVKTAVKGFLPREKTFTVQRAGRYVEQCIAAAAGLMTLTTEPKQ